MKKLNHIWIFSDSIKGHEIQSLALAKKIAHKVTLFHCTIRQPWLSFAPRVLPHFGRNIIWETQKPPIDQLPCAIVTCGRRMAAIGKFYKRRKNLKHIQILNPGDSPKKYDVVICPEHDQLKGQNIITTKGSLHSVDSSKIKKQTSSTHQEICLLIGNPQKGFFKALNKTAQKIQKSFPNSKLVVCGSRRTPERYYPKIKSCFEFASKIWLDETDGDNPYQDLLGKSTILLVTADSINMLSEACATDKNVIALALNHISPKHKRFVDSIQKRLSGYTDEVKTQKPLVELETTAKKVLELLRASEK